MNAVVTLTGILATLLASAAPALAHHSFAAEYDATKPIHVCGVVTKVEWTNPHARFYVQAQDRTGRNVIWNFELGPPGQLSRLGWSRHSLSVGTQVTVNGYRARDGSSLANATTLTLADGREVSAGSSGALNVIAKHDVVDRRLHQ
jgi:hypothetical protein